MVNRTNNENSEELPPGDLGTKMIEAMNNQSDAMDNLAGSIDDFAEAALELSKGINKKMKLGSIIGSAFGASKKEKE